MYNLENLTSEVTRYLEKKRGYHNADFDSLPTAEIDALRRAYDDAAHSVAFHAQIVADSLASLTYPASDASQFLIPAPDQAPNLNLSQHDRLRQMFDEPELPAGGYDTCRDCGEKRALDEFARCASCAAAKDEEIPSDFGDCRDCGGTMPLDDDGRCYSCAHTKETGSDPAYLTDTEALERVADNAYWEHNNVLAQAHNTPEEHVLYVVSDDVLYRLKAVEGHVRIEQQGPHIGQQVYELSGLSAPLHHDRYWNMVIAQEVIERYKSDLAQSDESQEADSSDWLTAATELDLESQVSDSGYLFDDDDYDDEWYEDEDLGWWLTDEALEELASDDESDTDAGTGATTVDEIQF